GGVTHTLLVTLAITRPPPDFNISASPASATLTPGSSRSVTITLQSMYNFTGTVNLAASVAPADTTASLSPFGPSASLSPASISISGNGSATSTLSVSTSLLTTPGTYTVTIKADSGTLSHSATVTITRSEEHTSELSHDQTSYAVFCLKKKNLFSFESFILTPNECRLFQFMPSNCSFYFRSVFECLSLQRDVNGLEHKEIAVFTLRRSMS